ncbi:unnamed protein product [Owenia fusiformis]|uniref:Uncharacterized protein n=1 Tax=Owenia fusiformis TaxID=6347 RepID=A0A8J1U844_OWEFU|nr:unnamed protein product [Owenia fusiformis]
MATVDTNPILEEVDEVEISIDDTPSNVRGTLTTFPNAGASFHNPPQYIRPRASDLEKWPLNIGIVQIVTGFLLVLAGVAEVFVIPLFDDTSGSLYTWNLGHANLFGVGLWTGAILIITGSTAVRSSISKRQSTVYRFFLLTILSMIVFIAAVILFIKGYAMKWNLPESYPPGSAMFPVHVTLTVLISFGLFIIFLAFMEYYETVFFGELQLLRKFLSCCLPCVCPKVRDLDNDRSPQMPV